MSQEIELKLALGEQGPEYLIRHPRLAALAAETSALSNTYFDTQDGALERARVALRIRQKGAQRLQTLKTSGKGSGGLSIRGEWEWPIEEPGLDLAGLAELPPMRDLGPTALDSLAPRFRTDFQRRAWQLEINGSHIELALDVGEIITGQRRAPIREAELELKSGEVEVLWRLALELAQWTPLRPASASKAARGAALERADWSLPEAGDTATGWFEQAIAALDAFDDSGDAAYRETARNALARLETLIGDQDLATHVRRLAEWNTGLSDNDRLTTEAGRTMVTLARELYAQDF